MFRKRRGIALQFCEDPRIGTDKSNKKFLRHIIVNGLVGSSDSYPSIHSIFHLLAIEVVITFLKIISIDDPSSKSNIRRRILLWMGAPNINRTSQQKAPPQASDPNFFIFLVKNAVGKGLQLTILTNTDWNRKRFHHNQSQLLIVTDSGNLYFRTTRIWQS